MSELASKLHPDEHTPEVTAMATLELQNTHLALCAGQLLTGLTEHRFFCNGVNDQPHRHWLFEANISTKIQSISARSIIKETKISPVVLGYFERVYSHLLCPSTCEIRVTHMHTHAGRDAVSHRRQARVSLVKPCYASGGQIPTEKSINIQIKFSCVFSLYLKRLKSQ